MIAHLRGTLLQKQPNQIILESGGVGYDVAISISTYSALPDIGGEVRLWIHTHVREDTLALFGFLTAEEKVLFEKLIGVSGIGPKLAITVLSGLTPTDLATSICSNNVDRLVRIPGVGKKTAERMVLELRDKLQSLAAEADSSKIPASGFTPVEEDVLSALLNLGCTRSVAEAALRQAKVGDTPLEFEPLFRQALEKVR